MKILVCIKQVPLIEHLHFNTESRRIEREGVESEINPFDKRALTQAVNIKKQTGAETTVVTMGPPQAAAALREALAMGIDHAVHLLGREFAGADTLATARALALAARRVGFDLILCGRYSTDAETAQVPGMLAELLDIPQVTGVARLEFYENAQFRATRELDDGFQTLEGRLPVLISAAERLTKPIKLTPRELLAAQDRPIEVMTVADLGANQTEVGIAGSPTWVESIYSIEPQRKRIIRTLAGDADRVAQDLIADLLREGLYGEWESRHEAAIQPHAPRSRPGRSFWTIVELVEGEIRPVSLELIGKSTELADQLDGEVAAVLLGGDVARHAKTLAEHGADKIYIGESPALAEYMTEPYTEALSRAIQQHKPFAVFLPSTANGRDLAPRVAARLGLGLTGDCVGLQVDEEGRVVQLKPAFGGHIIAPILTRTSPVMATVRPGMLQPAIRQPNRRAEVTSLPVEGLKSRLEFAGSEMNTEEGVALEEAESVVGVGMGVGGPENFPLLHDLARTLNAPLAATRRVVDAGWLPRQVQVGLTGRSISPELYIAVGVRGAFNHTVGIQRAGVIVAVNNNPEADIFKTSDYGIVGDWEQAIAALIPAFRRAREEMEKRKQGESI